MWHNEAQGFIEVMPWILEQRREVQSVDREVKSMDLGARQPGLESYPVFSYPCGLG